MKFLGNQRLSDCGTDSDLQQRLRYNDKVAALRETEYPMLKGKLTLSICSMNRSLIVAGITYLDHAGTTLPSKSLMEAFSKQMQSLLLANPHSALVSKPNVSHQIVEETRRKVLGLFKADPKRFDIVFVANATAGIKLVAEAFSGYSQGFDYYYHRDCHTSLVGVRELARRSHCFLSDNGVEEWIQGGDETTERDSHGRPTLFSYPAQSNMNGRRNPPFLGIGSGLLPKAIRCVYSA